MRLTRIIRPIVFFNRFIYSFSNHSQTIKSLKAKMAQHRQQISNTYKQGVPNYFNDNYLFGLVQENYCFFDLVDITNSIITQHPDKKTDKQIIFIAYAYNLFYGQLKNAKLIFEAIIQSLSQKILNKEDFESVEVQNAYLYNIKSLTNRSNKFLQSDLKALITTFFRFIGLKSDLIDASGKYKQVNGETIFNLLAVAPFIPKDSASLLQIQQYYNKLIKYYCSRLQQINKDDLRQVSKIFTLMMQIGVIIGKAKDKYINIFQSLPTSFQHQEHFITYLQVIKYFFTYQLIKKIDFKQFDHYNFQLSTRNKHYRSKQAMKSFQEYVESLISVNFNNLKVFDPYLFYQPSQKEEGKNQ